MPFLQQAPTMVSNYTSRIGNYIEMTYKATFFIGVLLTIIIIFVWAGSIEDGDINAISMYFVVFLLPGIFLTMANTFYIRYLSKLPNKTLKVFLSLLPVSILAILSLKQKLTVPFIDGNLSFIVKVMAIALGTTNIIWIISLFQNNQAKSNHKI